MSSSASLRLWHRNHGSAPLFFRRDHVFRANSAASFKAKIMPAHYRRILELGCRSDIRLLSPIDIAVARERVSRDIVLLPFKVPAAGPRRKKNRSPEPYCFHGSGYHRPSLHSHHLRELGWVNHAALKLLGQRLRNDAPPQNSPQHRKRAI